MKKRMNFTKAARITVTLVLCGLFFCLAGLMFAAEGDPMRVALVGFSFAFVVAGIIFACVYCRCPSCGRIVFMGMMKVTVCPSCHRDLNTGAKVKGKKK